MLNTQQFLLILSLTIIQFLSWFPLTDKPQRPWLRIVVSLFVTCWELDIRYRITRTTPHVRYPCRNFLKRIQGSEHNMYLFAAHGECSVGLGRSQGESTPQPPSSCSVLFSAAVTSHHMSGSNACSLALPWLSVYPRHRLLCPVLCTSIPACSHNTLTASLLYRHLRSGRGRQCCFHCSRRK